MMSIFKIHFVLFYASFLLSRRKRRIVSLASRNPHGLVTSCNSGGGSGLEGLLKVGNDVVDVLGADRDTNQVLEIICVSLVGATQEKLGMASLPQ